MIGVVDGVVQEGHQKWRRLAQVDEDGAVLALRGNDQHKNENGQKVERGDHDRVKATAHHDALSHEDVEHAYGHACDD